VGLVIVVFGIGQGVCNELMTLIEPTGS